MEGRAMLCSLAAEKTKRKEMFERTRSVTGFKATVYIIKKPVTFWLHGILLYLKVNYHSRGAVMS